jgi:hypothetical protein
MIYINLLLSKDYRVLNAQESAVNDYRKFTGLGFW